ncbi:MAG: proline--tRNA ligase [Deltaproteobacteria bacterium]|nr:proline--tRNA ligase [Candidatus Zymogenaceae bacterium]
MKTAFGGNIIRYTRSLVRTRREDPGDAELVSHRLLLKGGFIRQVSAGVFDFAPLAYRVMKKIMDIIRQEMDRIDGQELLMPVLNPASLWIETGRYDIMGSELIRFKDRRGTDMCLAMTNEETVTDLARGYLSSYRDLPFMLYHIQTKIRDEARPRGGLIRVREFLMKDAYSFHRDVSDLMVYYERIYNAYVRTFQRMALPCVPVEADSGAMGGSASHEFILPAPGGEDTFTSCSSCGMAANVERAEVVVVPKDEPKDHPAAEEVHTPEMTTIESVASFFGVDTTHCLKAVAYEATLAPNEAPEVVVAFINGAYDVNETKLTNRLKAVDIAPAAPAVLTELGIVPGFISPVGAERAGVRILFDRTVLGESVYVVGGDKIDYHIKNAVRGRDFTVPETVDIASIREGDRCASCADGVITLLRGVELGHCFQLGTRYSKAMNLTYLNEEGKESLVEMGCYGIGVERAMASVVEANHDENGIIWPVSVAPCHVTVIPLGKDDDILDAAHDAAKDLAREFEVFLDDRPESAGVKFADADLLGFPLRVIVSRKLIAKGQVEVKVRRTGEVQIIDGHDLFEVCRNLIDMLANSEGVLIDEE